MMKTRLVDVLIRNAMNWVNCECAFRLICKGLGGIDSQIALLESEINHLNLVVEASDIPALVSESKTQREEKIATLDALFAKWHSAKDVCNEYKRLFESSAGFCTKHYRLGYTIYLVFFNAILLGMDPTHAEPFQARCMPYVAKLISRLPADTWTSRRWATPKKPDIPFLRRVCPNNRNEFIKTVLVRDSELIESLKYDSASPDLHSLLSPPNKRRRR